MAPPAENAPTPERPSATARPGGVVLVLMVVGLSGLWLAFSGKFDLVHLAYGVVSVVLVVLLSQHLLHARTRATENQFVRRMRFGPALLYPFWLLGQIVLANVAVAKVILGPPSRLKPALLSFEFPVDEAVPRVVLGNSITITPGTFTLRVRGRQFLVHSIGPDTAAGIVDGTMQRRVARVFGHPDGAMPPVETRLALVDADRGDDA